MTIESRHRQIYPLSIDTYWREICLSLDFQERMYREALGCSSMEVVEASQVSDHAPSQRRLKFQKPIDAPAMIRKVFGEAVIIQEESSFDPIKKQWEFRMLPPLLADRIEIRGVSTLEAKPEGVEQTSVVRVSCKLLGLGGVIEHFVAKSSAEGNADKAAFTHRYIAEKGLR